MEKPNGIFMDQDFQIKPSVTVNPGHKLLFRDFRTCDTDFLHQFISDKTQIRNAAERQAISILIIFTLVDTSFNAEVPDGKVIHVDGAFASSIFQHVS